MIQPLYNNVLLQKEQAATSTASGIILSSQKDSESNIAKVLAVGKGDLVDGKLIPLDIKVGQMVIFKKYAATEFKYQDQEYLLVASKDILGVI